jgi:hypothetical protein
VHRNEKSLKEHENMRHANNNLEIGRKSVLSKRNKLKNAMFATLMLDNYEDQLQQLQKSKSKNTFRLLSVFTFSHKCSLNIKLYFTRVFLCTQAVEIRLLYSLCVVRV